MSSTPEEIRRGFLRAAWNGDEAKVRTYVSSYGLSYSAGWSNGYILLRNALENGHASVAKLLLDAGARVNSSGNPVHTPLHYAVEYSFKDIVERLLAKGARVNAINQSNSTPLHCAARQNNDEIIKLLLRHGASVDASDKYGTTALQLSVQHGDVPITQILLNYGASESRIMSVTSDKYTLLHTAADEGFEEICKLLLSRGASVNALSASHGTPLHVAIENGHLNLVKLFLQNGTDTNATNRDGDTCLHVAARKGTGWVEVVQALLAKGFSVDVRNSRGVTPAFLAAEAGNENMVSLLLEQGADVNIQDKNGKTILCNAVEKQSETFVDLVLKFSPDVNNVRNKSTIIKSAALQYGDTSGKIIEILLQYGFTTHLKVDDVKDVEVLQAAVQKGYFKLVEHLLNSCQDVVSLINATDSTGRTSLHVASENKREDIVELLISLGADVNALTCSQSYVRTEKMTPLFYSVKNNDKNISKILLKNKADANGCLLMAVRNKNSEMVELLLQHGADPNTKDKIKWDLLYWRSSDFKGKADSDYILRKWGIDVKGENFAGELVLKAAIGTQNTEIVEILLKYGSDVNEAAHLTTDKKCSVLKTPLMVAVATGNADITTMLLDKGAAVNVALLPKKVSALHIAVFWKKSSIVDVLLKQPDIDFDCEDFEKRTPLHYAVDHGNVEIAAALLKRGAGVNCRDHLGKTPLHCAAEASGAGLAFATYDGVDIAEALLRSGADVNARDAVHGFTPLHYWAENKTSQMKIFNSLLKYGADIDSRSKTDETPLSVAVKNRRKNSVYVLLRNGADVNIKHVIINKDGRCCGSSTAFKEATWLESSIYSGDHVECVDLRYFSISDLFWRHMIMLDSAKFYVNATDMNLLDSCRAPVFDIYRMKCEEELSLIKQTRVIGNPKVSFFDFLIKSPNKVASLLKKENMVEIISSEEFRKDLGSFVIYGDLINNRIKMALKRGNVLKTAAFSIRKMFSIPDLCIDSISEYLSNVDLNNFVEACKQSEAKSFSDRLM